MAISELLSMSRRSPSSVEVFVVLHHEAEELVGKPIATCIALSLAQDVSTKEQKAGTSSAHTDEE